MSTPAFLTRLLPAAPLPRALCKILGSAMFLAVAALLLRSHATVIHDLRDQGLPLAAEIPPLDRKLSLLTEEVQLSQMHRELKTGSDAERLRMYVLPTDRDLARTTALLTLFEQWLAQQGMMRGAPELDVGDTHPSDIDGLTAGSLNLTLTLNADGIRILQAFFKTSGFLTVSDAFTPDQIHDLLVPLEASNPSDIVALEQFLSMDFRNYAQAPRPAEERLLQSVSAPSFADVFRSASKASLLPEAQQVLQGDFGKMLGDHQMWPTPFFGVQALSLKPTKDEGFQQVTIALETYWRGEK